MQLNPHGDAAIYDTMVRLSRGYEALLHPYVDSKGNFGKAYSRDMQCAASRYTEAKLEPIAAELFRDIEKDTVDFVDNYDNTQKEPTLLPVTFPSILVNSNTGIAVGMASSICSFNLSEVCETAIEIIKDPEYNVADSLKAPDFAGGGLIIYDRDALENIYETGRGNIRVRSVYRYDKSNNCIDITQIPPTTTVEAVIEKVIDLVKQGKTREISDIRDETGIDGLRITIDLKRGADPEALMRKLYRMTTLEDTFSCNFNVLVSGYPKVMGVREIFTEWIAFRTEAVKRRTFYELSKKKDKLHLLLGLSKILLDIDKAVRIIRQTDEESDVVPNLMIGFGIDEIQAEYVAEIKLRHLNREYILHRTEEIDKLKEETEELQSILDNPKRISGIIIAELKNVSAKYGQPRKSKLIYAAEIQEDDLQDDAPDYPVNLFFTSGGYFKKITPQSLRMSSEQKLKDGDLVTVECQAQNSSELLFFTDKAQVYKTRASEFEDSKASVLGDYVPSKLEMDEGENACHMVVTGDYSGYVVFVFENGKVAKVELSSYKTKTNRRKLVNAYSDKSPLISVIHCVEDCEILIKSSSGRLLLLDTALVGAKTTKNTQGISVMTQRKGHRVTEAHIYRDGELEKPQRYRPKNLPSSGQTMREDEIAEQMKL